MTNAFNIWSTQECSRSTCNLEDLNAQPWMFACQTVSLKQICKKTIQDIRIFTAWWLCFVFVCLSESNLRWTSKHASLWQDANFRFGSLTKNQMGPTFHDTYRVECYVVKYFHLSKRLITTKDRNEKQSCERLGAATFVLQCTRPKS